MSITKENLVTMFHTSEAESVTTIKCRKFSQGNSSVAESCSDFFFCKQHPHFAILIKM